MLLVVLVLSENIEPWYKWHTELVWIQQLLTELGFKASIPMTLWCDNKTTMHIASNLAFHEKTKHIEVNCHFIWEKLQSGLILPTHIWTGEQLADIFTKPLGNGRIEYICDQLGMINIYVLVWGGMLEYKGKAVFRNFKVYLMDILNIIE